MPMPNVFDQDAFSAMNLTASINQSPLQYGKTLKDNIFREVRQPTTNISLEVKNGRVSLVPTTPRGQKGVQTTKNNRMMKNFEALHTQQEGSIYADDIQNVLIHTAEGLPRLAGLGDLLLAEQNNQRINFEQTLEYWQIGAMQGKVKDADGSVVLDLFSEFGLTETVVDFVLGTSTTDVNSKLRTVKRDMKKALGGGEMMTGVGCYASPEWFDKFLFNPVIKEAYDKYQSLQNPNREDVTNRFVHQGIVFEEYDATGSVLNEDGTATEVEFIAPGDARFYPMGTRNTFIRAVVPAPAMSQVNKLQPPLFYTSPIDEKEEKSVVSSQMNCLPFCARPQALFRGHTSN